MVGLMVLLAFVLIGLLDSLHFRPRLATQTPTAAAAYAVEVLSVLDVVSSHCARGARRPTRRRLRRSSTPRRPMELPDGRQARDYPRLSYGGAHLENPGAIGRRT